MVNRIKCKLNSANVKRHDNVQKFFRPRAKFIGNKVTVYKKVVSSLRKHTYFRQPCKPRIYYKYQKDKRIPLYERKTADKTYHIYKTVFHGNSYASLLYKEICKWEIDTISYQDLTDEE